MPELQSIVFKKSKWTLPGAKAWLKRHGYRRGLDEKPNSWRFRQVDPRKSAHYVTKQVEPGLFFIIMY